MFARSLARVQVVAPQILRLLREAPEGTFDDIMLVRQPPARRTHALVLSSVRMRTSPHYSNSRYTV